MKVVKTFIQDGKTAVKIISDAPVVPVTSFEFVQGGTKYGVGSAT